MSAFYRILIAITLILFTAWFSKDMSNRDKERNKIQFELIVLDAMYKSTLVIMKEANEKENYIYGREKVSYEARYSKVKQQYDYFTFMKTDYEKSGNAFEKMIAEINENYVFLRTIHNE